MSRVAESSVRRIAARGGGWLLALVAVAAVALLYRNDIPAAARAIATARPAWLAGLLALALLGLLTFGLLFRAGQAAAGARPGPWERYVLVIAAAPSAGLVPGLPRGRRAAWWLACAATAASAVAAWANDVDVLGLAPAAAAAVALVVTRRHFTGTWDVPLRGAGWRTLVFGEVALVVYAVTGLSFPDSDFQESTTVPVALPEAVRLAVVLPSASIEPTSAHAAWFVDSIRLLSALVVALALVRLLGPSRFRQHAREGRARQLEEPGAELVRARRLRVLEIGEEAIVPVRDFAVAGPAFKSLRSSQWRPRWEPHYLGIARRSCRSPPPGSCVPERAACYGLAAALVVSVSPGKKRRVAAAALAAWLLGALALNRDIADVQHAVAAAAGAAIGIGIGLRLTSRSRAARRRPVARRSA